MQRMPRTHPLSLPSTSIGLDGALGSPSSWGRPRHARYPLLEGLLGVVAGLAPGSVLTPAVTAISLALLVLLGGVAARAGGATAATGAARVGFWGALAMALTYGVGALFGAVT